MRSARAKGSKEDGTNLTQGVSYTRRISAKSGRGHASTLDSGVCSVSPSVALSFQLCANWDDAGLQIAPQSDQELARHSNDRNPTRATFEVADPFPEPAAERALRLIAQPSPGELDHHCARLGITGLADALVAIERPAAKWARCQAHIASQLPSIRKFAIEYLADVSRRKLRADCFQLGKHFDLLGVEMHLFLLLEDGNALSLNRGYHLEHDLQALNLAHDLGLESRR